MIKCLSCSKEICIELFFAVDFKTDYNVGIDKLMELMLSGNLLN